MSQVKIGLVGCGKITRAHHIPLILNLKKKAKITALYDAFPETAEKTREEFSLKAEVFKSLDKFVASGIDAVVISTPNSTHHPLAMKCLDAGLHVLVEKPMAATLKQADEMIRKAREKRVFLQVNQTLRFTQAYMKMKEMIEKGRIGKPLHVRCIRAGVTSPDKGWSPGAKWFLSKKACGGIVMDIAVHMADVMQWYFGRISSVSALTQTRLKDSEVPDNVSALFEFENGATGVLELSWTFPAGTGFLEIYGEKGAIRQGFNPAGIEFIAAGEKEYKLVDTTKLKAKTSHQCFVDSINGAKSNPCPGETGRNALALCAAITESGAKKKPVIPNTI